MCKAVLCDYLNLLKEPISSDYLNISESENFQFQIFGRNQKQTTINPNYFKNLKEPTIFMKE
jgi:hypothetical protein